MIYLVNLLLLLWFQNPVQKVVVGFQDDEQLVVENPKFTGFIETRDNDAVLIYREQAFHGELSVKSISRIDFGKYKKGKPFQLSVTLMNGQTMEVQTELRDFITVQGKTDVGTVTIKDPDPLSTPVKLTEKKENRKKDLTIKYLEFPR